MLSEYLTPPATSTKLERLYKLHNPTKDVKECTTMLKDWIPVIGRIVSVIIVYESMGHSLASKAVSFIRKA